MNDDDSQAFAGAAAPGTTGLVAALPGHGAWAALPARTLRHPRPGLLQHWWRQLCGGTRARRWSIVFAAAALIGLLFAFHSVVRGAVTQGEQRRAAVAARELALWRCSIQGSAPLRSSCRAALDGPPPVTLPGTSGR